MLIGPIADPVSRAAQSALDSVLLREATIADNLANAQTPDYLEKEVTFEDALARAMSRGTAPETVAGQVSITDSPVNVDGNSVDVTKQAMLLNETTLQYQSLVNIVNFRHSIISTGLAR